MTTDRYTIGITDEPTPDGADSPFPWPADRIAEDSGGWFWSPHGSRDSHIPECYPIIRFTEQRLDLDA